MATAWPISGFGSALQTHLLRAPPPCVCAGTRKAFHGTRGWRRQTRPTPVHRPHSFPTSTESNFYEQSGHGSPITSHEIFQRRDALISSLVLGMTLVGAKWPPNAGVALASEFTDMPAIRGKDYGKTKMRYPDYNETESGLQYKDLRVGNGPKPKMRETVVVDWDGYTIGYYGRIFEARNKTKGGSFEGDDKDFFKFRIGSQQVIAAFEEAVSSMALGGIRSDAG